MTYLLLSILSSSLIFIIFKWIGKLKYSNLTIIVVNYFMAGSLGWMLEGSEYADKLIRSDWSLPAVLLGSCFVAMFYLMARATQLAGTAPSVVANKMSVVIPVSLAFFLYGDKLTSMKIIGILLALIGIYLVTRKGKNTDGTSGHLLILLAVFAGSGFIDSAIKFIENYFIGDNDAIAFTATLFLTAFVSGIFIISFRIRTVMANFRFEKLLIGLLLGTVNFGSIYFLVLALRQSGLESSIVFPVNNIGIVFVSSLLSRILFKEHLSSWNMAGIAVSVLSLLLLMTAA